MKKDLRDSKSDTGEKGLTMWEGAKWSQKKLNQLDKNYNYRKDKKEVDGTNEIMKILAPSSVLLHLGFFLWISY